jgi:hypothetical protein
MGASQFVDLYNFYLGTSMRIWEYMRIHISAIPDSSIAQYKLLDLVHNAYVLVETTKGMYGLPQVGILAYEQLVTHLAKHGYAPCPHMPGLWKHATCDVTFCLVVDDYGVKYTNKVDAEYLINALREICEVTIDWTGSLYIGITLQWDYDAKTVDISMPGYIEKAVQRFNHTSSQRKQDSPYEWARPKYRHNLQLAEPPGESPLLDPPVVTELQEITCCVVDLAMLVALGTIAAAQPKGT